ncbi:unnamed protein product [Caenorhabditis angaria]|uniref:Tudor domain-containing protein n=1 Tax=Caenorhabditis angaria TaxID=860376 RepID=A0A9P1IGR9_9PELO|nr:unnamed protein product [Caenorhabditis angaria]
MIGIGNRPPEEELFDKKPIEPIANYPNGKGDPQMIMNGIDQNTKAQKINRLVLSRTAIVELLRVESPSKIWVRLTNHIADDTLTFKEPFDLKPKESFKIGEYAIAPYQARTFRRCLIEDIRRDNNNETIVDILFIDDALKYTVKPECLCEMDEHYMFFPWQAIQISLFQLFPRDFNLKGVQPRQKWSKETCDNLREVLEQFEFLRVEAVLSSVVFNDYSRATPCHIFGIENYMELETGSDILDLLLSTGNLPITRIPLYDAAKHQFFAVERSPSDEEQILTIHRGIPEEWKMTKKPVLLGKEATLSSDIQDWDPELCQIPAFTEDDLKSFADENNDILFSVEGICTKSPSRWYARPILKTCDEEEAEDGDENEIEDDPVKWMINGNEELLSAAEQLDTYYSVSENRKPLTHEEIKNLLAKSKDVFAVCAVNEDKSAYTGEWQRVQILKCETFAEVLFLDSGGCDMVLTSSLYRIHEQHCRYLPKCLQLSIHGLASGINSSRNGIFKSSECEMFRSALKVDVPLVINLEDIQLAKSQMDVEKSGIFNKNVFFVRDMRSYDEDESFMDYLKSRGLVEDEKAPVEWL